MGHAGLTLVSEPFLPPKKVCGSCALYEASRGQTGRVLWSQAGRCAWSVPTFDLPLAVIRGHGPNLPVMDRVRVFKDTNAETCKCWKPKSK